MQVFNCKIIRKHLLAQIFTEKFFNIVDFFCSQKLKSLDSIA